MSQGIGFIWIKRTEEKARVNWYRDGKLGITYLESSGVEKRLAGGSLACNVLREDEVEFRYGEIEPLSEKKDVRKMRDAGTLRERLRKLREESRQLTQKKRKSTAKRNKKKKESKIVAKNPEAVLESLSEQEKKMLKQMLKGE